MKKALVMLLACALVLITGCTTRSNQEQSTQTNNQEETEMNKAVQIELGNFIHYDQGQNFVFNACMAKLIECLGGDITLYTYDFFAGVGGDDFVMCYGDNDVYNESVSTCADTKAFLARTFGILKLPYTYVSANEFNQNKEQYVTMLSDYIGRGIPVLTKGTGPNTGYALVFSLDGTQMKSSYGEASSPNTFQLNDEIPLDFVFIDSLPQYESLADVYRQSVLQIPSLITAPKSDKGVYYGAQAYEQWASDIENGRYDQYTADTFDAWKNYTIYVCNLATNGGHGRAFLQKAAELNPDLTMIPTIIELYWNNETLWKGEGGLESVGGGFNVTLETLQDKEKRAVIADIIRKFIPYQQQVVACFA